MRLSIAAAAAAVVISTSAAAAQDRRPLETFEWNVSVAVTECTLEGATASGSVEYPPRGSKFMYLREATQRGTERRLAVIQFLAWKEGTDEYKTFNVATDRQGEKTPTFCVDHATFDELASPTYAWGRSSWDLAAGVLLLPIKMRLGVDDRPFDFSKSVTIGTVAGPRWRLHPTRDVFVSALVGAGIAAVTLDSANTAGVVQQSTDRAAVTLTVGTMLEVNRFQIGLMLGQDRISRPNQTDWAYQGRPWLSLGLGYALLSEPPEKPTTRQNSQGR